MDKIHGELRDIIMRLDDQGVQTRAIWGLINEQRPYVGELGYELEKAPFYSQCILNIPSSTQLTISDAEYTADLIMTTLRCMSYE